MRLWHVYKVGIIIKVDIEKAKQREIREKISAMSKESQNIMTEFAKNLSQVTPESGDLNELASLLSLPEDAFQLIAPMWIEELEKTYSNPAQKVLLAQTFNSSGVSTEDLYEEFESIMDTIENEMKDTLSVQKRDFLRKLIAITYNAVSETEGIAKRIIKIPYILCSDKAKTPTYAYETDAGLDIYSTEEITINPGETKIIPTGVKVELPRGYELQVRPKSGISSKTNRY